MRSREFAPSPKYEVIRQRMKQPKALSASANAAARVYELPSGPSKFRVRAQCKSGTVYRTNPPSAPGKRNQLLRLNPKTVGHDCTIIRNKLDITGIAGLTQLAIRLELMAPWSNLLIEKEKRDRRDYLLRPF